MDLFRVLLGVLLALVPIARAGLIPVTLRRPEHALQARGDELLSIFAPQDTANWTNVEDFAPYALSMLTLRHHEHRYVNLEHVEPFLQDKRVQCRQDARPNEPTEISLLFEDTNAFQIAKQQWSNQHDLLFTMEDEHCFEGPRERSVVSAESFAFDESQNKVTISGRPRLSHLHSQSGWAHILRLSLGGVPVDRELEVRTSVPHDLDPGLPIVERRGHGPLHPKIGPIRIDFPEHDLGKRHEFISNSKDFWDWENHVRLPRFFLACIDCHMRGGFTMGVEAELDITPLNKLLGHRDTSFDDFHHKRSKLQPALERLIEADRQERHAAHGRIKRGESGGDERDPSCGPGSLTFPYCPVYPPGALANCTTITSPYFPACYEVEPPECKGNNFLKVTKGVKNLFSCLGDTIAHDETDCWHCFVDDLKEFKSIRDYLEQFLKAHLRNVDFRLTVDKPIDVKFQMEALFKMDMKLFMTLDWYFPNVWVPSGGLNIGSGESSPFKIAPEKLKKDESRNKKIGPPQYNKPGRTGTSPNGKTNLAGVSSYGWEATPLSIEIQVGGKLELNWTMPGINVKMSKGEYLVRFLPQDHDQSYTVLKNTLNATFEYLESDLHINAPSVMASFAFGPKFQFTLLPGLPFFDNHVNKGSVKDSLTSAKKLGLGSPFAIGARMDASKTEFVLQKAKGVNSKCGEDGSEGESIMFKIVQRVGMSAYSQFFMWRLDTSWVGNIDPGKEATPGLYYSFPLYKHCWPIPSNVTSDGNDFKDHFHKALHKMQQPIKKVFDKIENFFNHPAEPEFNRNNDTDFQELAMGQRAAYRQTVSDDLDREIEELDEEDPPAAATEGL